MNSRIPEIEIEIDPSAEDPRLEAIYAAIDKARMPDREGPFGFYDYTGYGDPVPHHVRDFREYGSPTYGDCIFKSTDRDTAFAVYERLTREHVAIAAITATLKALGLSPLRHEPVAATDGQREVGRASALYAQGDMQLAWLNTGDLHQHEMIPDPQRLGTLAARDSKKASDGQ